MVKIPHDNGTGVYFDFYAVADDWAGISKVWCTCGYTSEKVEDDSIGNGDKWVCPDCNNTVEFRWHGMSWRQLPSAPKICLSCKYHVDHETWTECTNDEGGIGHSRSSGYVYRHYGDKCKYYKPK